MSDIPDSNISTKQYCPKCGSFHIKRLHRGYVKKIILKQPIQYKCMGCKEQFSELDIADNEVRKVPIFISD